MGSSLWPWVAQLQATTSKPQQTLCGVGYVHREQIGDFVISSSMPLHLHLYHREFIGALINVQGDV